MREFVDERGRSWGIRVDVTTIRKVREKVGIDLTKAMDSQENCVVLLMTLFRWSMCCTCFVLNSAHIAT